MPGGRGMPGKVGKRGLPLLDPADFVNLAKQRVIARFVRKGKENESAGGPKTKNR